MYCIENLPASMLSSTHYCLDTIHWKEKYTCTFHGCFTGLYSVLIRTPISFPVSCTDVLDYQIKPVIYQFKKGNKFLKTTIRRYLPDWKLWHSCPASSFAHGQVCERLQDQTAGEMLQAIKQKLREYVKKQCLYVFILPLIVTRVLRFDPYFIWDCTQRCSALSSAMEELAAGGFFQIGKDAVAKDGAGKEIRSRWVFSGQLKMQTMSACSAKIMLLWVEHPLWCISSWWQKGVWPLWRGELSIQQIINAQIQYWKKGIIFR